MVLGAKKEGESYVLEERRSVTLAKHHEEDSKPRNSLE